MKNISSLFALGLFLFFISCTQDSLDSQSSDATVPDAIKKAFLSDRPNTDAKWYRSGDNFEAVYKENKLEREVTYNAKGKIIATESELTESQIPASIKDYLGKNYNGQKITEAEMEENEKGVFYDIELKIDGKETELVFDANGNFLETENEDRDDDDGDDDDDENEVEIDISELPRSIQDNIGQSFPNATLLEADKITHKDGRITYDVEIKTDGKIKELMYDAYGKFLGEEIDDDDDDDGHEHDNDHEHKGHGEHDNDSEHEH